MVERIDVLQSLTDAGADLENLIKGHSDWAKGGSVYHRFINGAFVIDACSVGRGTIAFPTVCSIGRLEIELAFDYGGNPPGSNYASVRGEKASYPDRFGFGVRHEFVGGPRGGMPAYRGPLWAFSLQREDVSGEVTSFNARVDPNSTYVYHADIPSAVNFGRTLNFSLSVSGSQQTLTTPWGEFKREWDYPNGVLAFEISNGGALKITRIIAEVNAAVATKTG